jgi:hypothetical protein
MSRTGLCHQPHWAAAATSAGQLGGDRTVFRRGSHRPLASPQIQRSNHLRRLPDGWHRGVLRLASVSGLFRQSKGGSIDLVRALVPAPAPAADQVHRTYGVSLKSGLRLLRKYSARFLHPCTDQLGTLPTPVSPRIVCPLSFRLPPPFHFREDDFIVGEHEGAYFVEVFNGD